jgi:phosphoribosylanthranilate isomerase
VSSTACEPKELIQVAGVIDQAEADLLMDLGVPLLGFPLRLRVHAEDLSEEDAARIIRGLPAGHQGVIITYLDRAEELVSLCRFLGAPAVQAHGDLSVTELERIKALDPDLYVIKSLVVGLHPMGELRRIVERSAAFVDAFITDTFDPCTGASGATGRTHDWALSRELVELSPRPVILAGGLNAENVREAVLAAGPAGVDSHTGLEDTAGRKDRAKVERFLAEAREALEEARCSSAT